MGRTESNSAASQTPHDSIDSSKSRSRRDSSPWTAGAIHDDPAAPSVAQSDPLFSPPDKDKKHVWKKPSSSSAEAGPVMGAESWPALSQSARPSSSNKSPSLEPILPMPQAAGTPTSNANSGSIAASSDVNGQRKPFRRNNSPSNSRGASRNSQRYRNGSSYPRGDGRRNLEHGNQTGFSHRRDMHLQPRRGFVGIMRPQLLMSFPPTGAQFMAAPQPASYGGPLLYPDYPPHVFIPHPPPELPGHLPPLAMCFDPILYSKIFTQVEYYFSADNLSKDKHLRRQMNDEGWVPVRVIAGFRRLAELTNNIHTILEVLRSSQVVEIKGEALRRRGDWDKYLLPREASRSGPAALGNNNASLGSQLESMTLSERSREAE